MAKPDDLKALLAKQLNTESPDYGELVSLAHKLADASSDSVRFTVDAGHISRLGLELVSKQETAVSELVKNAFDADALTVDVIFKGTDVPGGSMEVIDTGLGMSREQLRDGFMRLSTMDKVKEPFSPKYHRKRAGRKGIGRFATQRLGRRLRLETQQPDTPFSLVLEIDWERFEAGLDLHTISNQIVVSEPKPTQGTTLLISDLRDTWSDAQIRRAYRYVSDLLQPYPLDRKSVAAGLVTTDPGFQAGFYREVEGRLESIASEETSILANAVAKISAHVDQEGNASYTVQSDTHKISLIDQALPNDPKVRSRMGYDSNTYPLVAGVHLTAYYFISDELPAGLRGTVRDVLTRTGGVRVYRNGFRVLPYGDPFDDWLGLQRSSALRQVLPPHHSTNFIGFVEVVDHDGVRFEETASREGLVENDAFTQLKDFTYRALVSSVIEVARARGRKVFASDPSPKGPGSEPPQSPRDKAGEVASRLRDIAASAKAGEEATAAQRSAKITELAVEVEELGADSELLLQEIGMLRVLASLGLTIGEFTHEVRHALVALSASIEEMVKGSQEDERTFRVVDHMTLLRSYMMYFDEAVSQNADRSVSVHELRDVVNKFIMFVKPSLVRQKVEVEAKFHGYDLFTRPMHKSEWASILLNLCTNSLKAIHRAAVAGRILIESGVQEDSLYVDFSDNGDGIPFDSRERVFEAFYTTSAVGGALSGHNEQLMGTGLGLKIVRDIVESIGGTIEVVDPIDGFSTRIRILVPRAREEQIGDARY